MKQLTKILVSVAGVAAICVSSVTLGGCGSRKESITVSGSSSVTPIMEKLAAEYEKTHDVRITINMSSSGAGISDAQNGLNDFGMSSRELKESETGIVGKTLCMDGIALIVGKTCAVTDVSKSEIKALYESGYFYYGGNRKRCVKRNSYGVRRIVGNRARLRSKRCYACRNGERDRGDSKHDKQYRLHILRKFERYGKSGQSGRRCLQC